MDKHIAAAGMGVLDGSGRRGALLRLFPEARDLARAIAPPWPRQIAAWTGSPWAALARALTRGDEARFIPLAPGLVRGPAGVPPISAVPCAGSLSAAAILDSAWSADDALQQRARAALSMLAAARIGGACFLPDAALRRAPEVLVIAPPADGGPLRRMLALVRATHPADAVTLYAPGAPARRAAKAAAAGWQVVTRHANPWSLLDAARCAYVVDDEIGVLALVKGLPVHCFGAPFYAGRGVTTDDLFLPARRARSLVEIVAAACLVAARYADPFTGRPCSFEDAAALVSAWRRLATADCDIAVCTGMSFWKRRQIARFFALAPRRPVFRRSAAGAVRAARARNGAIAVWSAHATASLIARAERARVRLVRVEDGFLRSVGLGAEFMPPSSIVVDPYGIYYDPAAPSALDAILGHAIFTPDLVARARRLRETLVARGVTKYNTGAAADAVDWPAGVRRIFVPGQVEDDRSVVLGGGDIGGNRELLARVRARNPDAFIVYKPHPDVDAGLRRGSIADDAALAIADRVVRGVSAASLIQAVDEVHTLTSLAGFEALLRGRRVVAYGRPFYAGWGLTEDLGPIPHRRRRLALDELVAGCLILYPRYLDPVTGLPCGPEVVVDRFQDAALWQPGLWVRVRRMQGALARRWQRPRVGAG